MMKKSAIFVLIAIVLVIGAIVRKEVYYGDGFHPFLPWIITGFFVGVFYSVFWILHCRPKFIQTSMLSYIFEKKTFVLSLSTFICMIFFSMSIVDLAYTLKKTTLEIASWPSLTATVVSQDIYEAPPGRYRNPRWAAIWSYDYSIDGRKYQSHSRSVPLGSMLGFRYSEELARKDLELHPIGSSVTAYYNPLLPEQTVLIKRQYDPQKGYWLILIGSFLLICSVVGTVIVSQRVKAKLNSTSTGRI